ncbi:MAG: hypothetical protein KDA60_00840, partial [Planctomycetales bacterium]|nr:hypothetical protein [Planctomycetales bacterium]
ICFMGLAIAIGISQHPPSEFADVGTLAYRLWVARIPEHLASPEMMPTSPRRPTAVTPPFHQPGRLVELATSLPMTLGRLSWVNQPA